MLTIIAIVRRAVILNILKQWMMKRVYHNFVILFFCCWWNKSKCNDSNPNSLNKNRNRIIKSKYSNANYHQNWSKSVYDFISNFMMTTCHHQCFCISYILPIEANIYTYGQTAYTKWDEKIYNKKRFRSFGKYLANEKLHSNINKTNSHDKTDWQRYNHTYKMYVYSVYVRSGIPLTTLWIKTNIWENFMHIDQPGKTIFSVSGYLLSSFNKYVTVASCC